MTFRLTQKKNCYLVDLIGGGAQVVVPIDADAHQSGTAVLQIRAEAEVLVYFRKVGTADPVDPIAGAPGTPGDDVLAGPLVWPLDIRSEELVLKSLDNDTRVIVTFGTANVDRRQRVVH